MNFLAQEVCNLVQCLSKCEVWTLVVPAGSELCIIHLKMLVFSLVLVGICSDSAEAMVGKTAGSAQIDAVATNCTSSLCIFHHYKLNFLKKASFA